MSFKALLKVDGNEYGITAFNLIVLRAADTKGNPTSKPAWRMDVFVDPTNDTTLTEWMIDPRMQKDGEIEVFKTDADSKLKLITFKKAYLAAMVDDFYSYDSFMKCMLRIIGDDITVGEAPIPIL